jgi:hypothetical protein
VTAGDLKVGQRFRFVYTTTGLLKVCACPRVVLGIDEYRIRTTPCVHSPSDSWMTSRRVELDHFADAMDRVEDDQ